MKITLKDGSVLEYQAPISVAEVAKNISEGLARVAVPFAQGGLGYKETCEYLNEYCGTSIEIPKL